MTDGVRTPWRPLPVLALALAGGLVLTGCGSLSRFAADEDRAATLPGVRVSVSQDAATVEAQDTSPEPAMSPASLPGERREAAQAVQSGEVVTKGLESEALVSARDAEDPDLSETTWVAIETPSEMPDSQEMCESPESAIPEIATAGDDIDSERSAAAIDAVQPSALLQQPVQALDEEDFEPYDPWVSFNEKMFEFNRRLDRHVLKPVATAYDRVVPDRLQTMVSNAFDNIKFVPRFVNNLLQRKWDGALREFGRFAINTTVGIGGLFDMAQQEWGIRRSQEDFGQTLGVWGAGPGPYLILPFFEPMTVRDGIGRAVDGFLDPLTYLLPFLWERLTMRVVDTVNERSMNLELFQGFEETVIDMYSAVRHVYLQRRARMIRE